MREEERQKYEFILEQLRGAQEDFRELEKLLLEKMQRVSLNPEEEKRYWEINEYWNSEYELYSELCFWNEGEIIY